MPFWRSPSPAGAGGGAVYEINTTAASDGRYKTDRIPLTHVLEKLATLQLYDFAWTADAVNIGKPPGQRDIGLIAQDVERVFPQFVGRLTAGGDRGEYMHVRYNLLSSVLVQGVNELHEALNVQMGRAASDRVQLHRHSVSIDHLQRELRTTQEELRDKEERLARLEHAQSQLSDAEQRIARLESLVESLISISERKM